MSLYRDDGLIVMKNKYGQQTNRIRKKIVKIFKDSNFSNDITTNLVEVDFLDFLKHNDHTESQKQLANTINDILSTNSSSEKVFNEDSLNESGYKTQLEYKITSTSINCNNKNRKRKIVWLSPPYNQSVSTNVAQTFIKLIDKHFPYSNRLHKII